jgi:hypothetical protein
MARCDRVDPGAGGQSDGLPQRRDRADAAASAHWKMTTKKMLELFGPGGFPGAVVCRYSRPELRRRGYARHIPDGRLFLGAGAGSHLYHLAAGDLPRGPVAERRGAALLDEPAADGSTDTATDAPGFWCRPPRSRNDRFVLIDRAGTAPQQLEVEILERSADQVRVRHANLSTNELVWTKPDHWQASYRPTAYRSFFAALADPIIILFLGGCLLADASVKYRLDRAMTRLFLKPVGERPR